MEPCDKKIDELLEQLSKVNEELIREKSERQQSESETEALLKGTRAVLEYQDFKISARTIFDTCKDIIGAAAGYVALLTSDGSENEVLFLEAGGLPCTVDPSLPMPIRGLREVAYRTGEVVYDNNFHTSTWMDYMPEGHVQLDNVMFSPLKLDGKGVGLIGLANKPGGFTDRDAKLASAFGEYAAISLLNSRSKELLEINEKKLRSVVDTAGDAIITIDSNQKVIYWNKASEKLFNYAVSEALNKDISIIIPERYKQRHKEGAKRVSQTGQSKLFGKTFEISGLRKNGEEFPVEISLAMWKVKEDTYYTGIIRDITERKNSQEQIRRAKDNLELLVQIRTNELSKAVIAMQESEEKYRGIFNDTQTPILIFNPDTQEILEANDRACSFYGYKKGEFTKKKIPDIHTLSDEQLRAIIVDVKNNKHENVVTRHRLSSGEIRDVEIYASPIRINEKVIICAMVHDITERKRLEEEIRIINLNLQKRVDSEVENNRNKDQLMYEHSRHISLGELLINISHHWRQPLCSIGLTIQDIKDAYMHDELDGAYIKKTVGLAMSELKSLSDTIDNFRNFYIQTKEQMEFNIAGEINKAERLISGYVKEKDIIVEKDLDKSLTTQGYQNEFAQVVLNILTNAKDKFEKSNLTCGTIKIRLYRDTATDRKVITIADSGGGVPDDIINKVFDPYFTTKDKSRGTGMGLYMAKVIIEKNMHGSISIRNIDGWCELRIEI
ncbi:PAS domain S-box protein [Candidatus Magnetominusculus xianensis]|uniref:histidine kinase n=1 Tax=Candidatus Magnetominusculus xianensis TaxID=1748249 RepID=A0ABR5SB01_9BACT|nr:PAS domain S-box protein [Candidatus Magnetominusculus xianensis]KWT75609.1 multi-sensor signal transduction histidine kinase [Candidatus Magnetominusculus xianensis]MBF0403692.1 PAS domain S-box protein [Nitrospirota bacterium]